MAKRQHDWQKISKEYIEADSDSARPTLQELASHHGISFGYIQQVCYKDKWVEQSQIYIRKVSEKVRAARIEAFAKEQSEFDTSCFVLSKALLKQLITHFNNANESKSAIKPTELNNLANVLSTAQKTGRTALGIYDLDDESLMDKLERKGYKTIDPTIDTNDA